jgi:multidrug transporter EmrE-like cation transporter
LAWILLIAASLFEVLWAICLKFLSLPKIKKNLKDYGISHPVFWISFVPLLGYILFGISNITLFSAACKEIPMTIAFAVWTALALVIQTIIDVYVFKDAFNKKQLFYILLIIIGIIGMRIVTPIKTN